MTNWKLFFQSLIATILFTVALPHFAEDVIRASAIQQWKNTEAKIIAQTTILLSAKNKESIRHEAMLQRTLNLHTLSDLFVDEMIAVTLNPKKHHIRKIDIITGFEVKLNYSVSDLSRFIEVEETLKDKHPNELVKLKIDFRSKLRRKYAAGLHDAIKKIRAEYIQSTTEHYCYKLIDTIDTSSSIVWADDASIPEIVDDLFNKSSNEEKVESTIKRLKDIYQTRFVGLHRRFKKSIQQHLRLNFSTESELRHEIEIQLKWQFNERINDIAYKYGKRLAKRVTAPSYGTPHVTLLTTIPVAMSADENDSEASSIATFSAKEKMMLSVMAYLRDFNQSRIEREFKEGMRQGIREGIKQNLCSNAKVNAQQILTQLFPNKRHEKLSDDELKKKTRDVKNQLMHGVKIILRDKEDWPAEQHLLGEQISVKLSEGKVPVPAKELISVYQRNIKVAEALNFGEHELKMHYLHVLEAWLNDSLSGHIEKFS